MTAEQIKEFIARKLFSKKRAALTQADFISAWGDLTSGEKDALIASAIAGNTEDTGQHIAAMLNRFAQALAVTRADEIAADGAVNLAEFNEIFD